MKENLIQLIEEQTFLNFTGKINVLEKNKSMFIGAIIFFEGDVFNSEYYKLQGMEALEGLFFLEFDNRELKYVVEPEMVEGQMRKIHYPFSVLKKKITEFIQMTAVQHAKAPPAHIKVAANSDIISDGQSLTSDEFDVLKAVCDYNVIKDIYEHTELPDFRVTNALVKLRKKNAIKVIK